jgi:5-methylcytosine-specific restriction endonuclease McrA
MVSTLKRQLTDDEKAIILKRFGCQCYATGHTIPEGEQIQFDHIHAHGLGGDSEVNNIAPMCAQHNLEKGQLSLGDFRIKLQLDEFFVTGDKQTLRHLLSFLLHKKRIVGFGRSVA